MEELELREKWVKSITNVDDRFLRMVDALYESYSQNELDTFHNLPEVAKKLINQGLEDSSNGRIQTHEDVMADFRKKYNLV